MDSFLEQLGPALEGTKSKTEKERVDAVLNHPLFMNSLGESEDKENENTVSALQSLVFDGTPQGIYWKLTYVFSHHYSPVFSHIYWKLTYVFSHHYSPVLSSSNPI